MRLSPTSTALIVAGSTSLITLALFWGIWGLTTGYVPSTHSIMFGEHVVMLPIPLSRWFDVPFGVLYALTITFVLTRAPFETLRAWVIFCGMILISALFIITINAVFILVIGLVFGITIGLAAGSDAGLWETLRHARALGYMCGIVTMIVVWGLRGILEGLMIGMAFGLVSGCALGLLVALGVVLGAMPTTLRERTSA